MAKFLKDFISIYLALILITSLQADLLNKSSLITISTKTANYTSSTSKFEFTQFPTKKSFINVNGKSQVVFEYMPVSYGINMYRLLNAFMYALITDSSLLIKWKEVKSYIESPFPNAFNLNSELHIYEHNNIYNQKTSSSNSWNRRKHLVLNATIPANYKKYYVTDMTAYFFDLCSNPDYFAKLLEYKLVKNETIERALSALNDEQTLIEQKVENFLLIGFEFAGSILNSYWKINTYMLEKVEEFENEHFQDAFVIGMQLRFYYLNENDVNVFINCAWEIEQSVRASGLQVKWYLSTDNIRFLERMRLIYSGKILSGMGKIGHHIVNSEVYERNIFDLEMLSRCDELIFTGGSTFGFLPSLMSQKRPYFVNGKTAMKKCEKMKFSRPPTSPNKYAVF